LLPIGGGVLAFDGVNPPVWFDADRQVWVTLDALPSAQGSGSTLVALSGTEALLLRGSAAARIDVVTGESRMIAQPEVLERPEAVAMPDGRILVMATPLATEVTDATLWYHPDDDTWQTGPPLLGARSRGAAALLSDGSILVAGGWDETMTCISRVERLRPGATAWTLEGALCTGRTDPILIVEGERILVVGGNAAGGGAERTGGFTVGLSPARTIEALTEEAPL
jgi:hypothetical protein